MCGFLGRCALRRLSIDHTSLGRASESFIATGILSNRCLTLTTLTGFRLGAAFARLGMPPQVIQQGPPRDSHCMRERSRRGPIAD